MKEPEGPYDLFDPSRPGWLHRRADNGDQILNEDLVRVITANPDLVPDATVRDLVLRGLKGELKAKRGRKRKMSNRLREMLIVARYDAVLPRLQARAARRKAAGYRKPKADRPPAECLHRLLGQTYGMEEESVRNLISRQNRR